MMKALKKYYRKAVPALAILAVYLLVAAIIRGVSLYNFRMNENSKYTDESEKNVLVHIWREIKNLFDWSHFHNV